MELNKLGFVIKNAGGVEVFSHHSALSGAPLGGGAITVPVSDVPGLFYRLGAGEGRLTAEQRADIDQRAIAWHAARHPAPKSSRRPVAAISSEENQEKEG